MKLTNVYIILSILIIFSSSGITQENKSVSSDKANSKSFNTEKIKSPGIYNTGHNQLITSIDERADGKYFLTSGFDGRIIIWNKKGRMKKIIETGTGGINSARFSFDGKYIICSKDSRETAEGYVPNIFIYTMDGILINSFNGGYGLANSLHINKKNVIVFDTYKYINLYDFNGKKIGSIAKEDNSQITSSLSDRNGDYLYLTSNNMLFIWNIEKNQIETKIDFKSKIVLRDISHDGNYIAITSSVEDKENILFVLDLKNKNCNYNNFQNLPELRILNARFTRNPHEMIIYNKGGEFLFADINLKKITKRLRYSPSQIGDEFENYSEFNILRDNKTMIVAGLSLNLHLCNIESNEAKPLYEFTPYITEVSKNIDSSIIAIGDQMGRLTLFNNDGAMILRTDRFSSGLLKNITFADTSIAFTTGYLRAGGDEAKKSFGGENINIIKNYITDHQFSSKKNNSKIIQIPNNHFIDSLKFSTDGKYLVSGSIDGIKLFNDDGELINHIKFNENVQDCIADINPYNGDITALVNYNIKSEKGNSFTVMNVLNIYAMDGTLKKSIKLDAEYERIMFTGNGEIALGNAWAWDNIYSVIDNNGNLIPQYRKKGNNIDYYMSMAISDDGNLIATSTRDDFLIKIWNRSGELLQTLKGHKSAVLTLHFLNNEQVISGSLDSTSRVWNIKTGSSVIISTSASGKSITYTDDSFYSSNTDGFSNFYFNKNNSLYSFEQFDLRYNRPDIIAERFISEKYRTDEQINKIKRYKKYWELRVSQNELSPEKIIGSNIIHAPEVFDIKINGLPLELSDEEKSRGMKEAETTVISRKVELSFKIKIEDGSDTNLKGYKIFVNGVPIHGQKIKLFVKEAPIQTVTETITLSAVPDIGRLPGENKIEISGFTSDGIESNREEIDIKYNGDDKAKKGRLFIVAIGVKAYDNLTPLTYPTKDVDDIVKVFSKNEQSVYSEVMQPQIYKDSNFSRKSLIKIKEYLKGTTVDDTVIFFMSGHGERVNTEIGNLKKISSELGISHYYNISKNEKDLIDTYYFIPGDADVDKLWEKAVPMDFIRYTLDSIPARQKILMLDSCKSGESPSINGYKPSKEKIAEVQERRKIIAANRVPKSGVKAVRKGDPLTEEQNIINNQAIGLEMLEMNEMFPELRRGTGTIEISAASGIQWAVEDDEWSNGAFTYAILELMNSKKPEIQRSSITVKAFRKYVLDRVMEITEEEQTPMVCRDIPGRDFVIGK